MNKLNIGSTFDSFLEEEGIKQEVEQRINYMKTSEDMDPIETVIDWLEFLVDNDKVSVHDEHYLKTRVIPEAKAQYLMLTSVKSRRFEYETED